MRLVITAEPEQAFNAWLEQQRQSAPDPMTDEQNRGLQVLTGSTCVMCHTRSGNSCAGAPRSGPYTPRQPPMDRCGSIAQYPKDLGRWIRDPQLSNLGVRMPQHPFSDTDLNALVAYLQTLK